MKKLFTLLVVCFAVIAASAQTCDLAVTHFMDNPTDQNVVETIDLGQRNGLNPVVFFTNNGPDALTTSVKVYINLYVNGSPITDEESMWLVLSKDLPAGENGAIASQTALLPADVMDQMGLATFDFGYEMAYAGDPVTTNNMGIVHVIRRVGIEDVDENGVNVYPNPATEVINIANAEGAQISIFDIAGKLISSVASASANEAISCADFAKGLYIVRIAEGNKVITKKVSVVR